MSIKFKYLGTEVELRNPELGDIERIDMRTSFKRDMDGGVHGFINGDPTTILSLNFTEIHRDKLLELIAFHKLVAGNEIQYTDYDGATWDGYIITNPLEFHTLAKLVSNSSQCIESYSFTVDFEGSKE